MSGYYKKQCFSGNMAACYWKDTKILEVIEEYMQSILEIDNGDIEGEHQMWVLSIASHLRLHAEGRYQEWSFGACR